MKGKRRVSLKRAKQYHDWGYRTYRKMRLEGFTVCLEWFVDSPLKKRAAKGART